MTVMKEAVETPLTETAFLILLAMYRPNHGYGVMQFVEEKTEGRVVFGPGTLYGAINNLFKKGLIEKYPTDPSERRQDYVITPLGKSHVQSELKRMQEVVAIAEGIVRSGEHD